MTQLQVTDLSTGYDKKALQQHIHFQVEKGDYICVIGENGSGKSTLLKTLLGLIPALEGDIYFRSGLSIGYLPQQNSISHDFPASVKEVVLSGFVSKLKWRPFYSKKEKEMASYFMEKMGILDYQTKAFTTLSGGQQQRVLLARALCASREFLFLDEPTAGLDEQVTKELYQLINQLNQEDGMTIFMVTHDKAYAIERASHLISLENGFFFGKTEDYRTGGTK